MINVIAIVLMVCAPHGWACTPPMQNIQVAGSDQESCKETSEVRDHDETSALQVGIGAHKHHEARGHEGCAEVTIRIDMKYDGTRIGHRATAAQIFSNGQECAFIFHPGYTWTPGAARTNCGFGNQNIGFVPTVGVWHHFVVTLRASNIHTFAIESGDTDAVWSKDFTKSGYFAGSADAIRVQTQQKGWGVPATPGEEMSWELFGTHSMKLLCASGCPSATIPTCTQAAAAPEPEPLPPPPPAEPSGLLGHCEPCTSDNQCQGFGENMEDLLRPVRNPIEGVSFEIPMAERPSEFKKYPEDAQFIKTGVKSTVFCCPNVHKCVDAHIDNGSC